MSTFQNFPASVTLFIYETESLLNALRRDYRKETDLSIKPDKWAEWHGMNARMDLRLLEIINPKHPAARCNVIHEGSLDVVQLSISNI